MVSATHAHTGPVVMDASIRYKLDGEMESLAKSFSQDLPKKIARAVSKANAALTPARLAAAMGHESSLAFNRRFFMKDGTVGWNPGKKNPNIARPAGPIDPDVPVIHAQSLEAKHIATYVNYAMHLDTVGGTEISADYPYTLSNLLAAAKPGTLTLFTAGCAGNINHVDVSTAEVQRGHSEAARIGTVLAAEVLKTFKRFSPIEKPTLVAKSAMVGLPADDVSNADLPKLRAVADKFGNRNAAPFLDLVHAFKVLDIVRRENKPTPVEVQVFTIGRDVAFVSLPGEIFVELGQAIKLGSPYPITVVASIANGAFGYIPDRRAYPQGAYEVVSTRFAPGSGEMLVDHALQLLRSAFTTH